MLREFPKARDFNLIPIKEYLICRDRLLIFVCAMIIFLRKKDRKRGKVSYESEIGSQKGCKYGNRRS